MKTGIGIRPELFSEVFERKPDVGFFEAHSENYFGESIARAKLLELRQDYPVSLHGVGLSLGRADNLDAQHLQNLTELVNQVEPVLVSEHLAWSAYSHTHVPDLLPLPLTQQALDIICQHIEQLQERLQRTILVENPSNYLIFDQMPLTEPEFLNVLAERSGCQMLLDINNIAVSAHNCQRDAQDYIQQINSAAIGQYHLAGYTPVERNGETVLIDTHSHRVYDEVWQLFKQTIDLHGKRPTLFEWDSDFPEFEVLLDECNKADAIIADSSNNADSLNNAVVNTTSNNKNKQLLDLSQQQTGFLKDLLKFTDKVDQPARFWVYQNNVYSALHEYLADVYPALQGVLGKDFFAQTMRQFIQQHPPEQGNLHLYGGQLIDFASQLPALKELPYIGDLARYEWALHCAYYSVTSDSLEPQGIAQEELLSLPIEFNDSVFLLESVFPISAIHQQSLPDYQGQVDIDLAQGADNLLVYKQGYAVNSHALNESQLLLCKALQENDNLLQAIEYAQGHITVEQLSATLAWLIGLSVLKASN